MCIHVATAVEEVAYEAIAELQELLEQAQQEVSENPAQGPVDPSTEQQSEDKPRSITYYFTYEMLSIYLIMH